MTYIKQEGKGAIPGTLERLSKLYRDKHIRPGKLVRVGIKPLWTLVTGSQQECGIASNGSGILPSDKPPSGSLGITRIQKMIHQPLFEIAATGIRSDDVLERSLGIAALSALSQQFLSCSSVRKRGFLSECWKATDPFILQYPVLSRLVTMDDVVVIVGHGTEIRDLRGKCRELHVIDPRSPATFSTLLIDASVQYGPKDLVIHSGKQDTAILRTADVILINASSLSEGSFEDLMQYTENARLVGLFGLAGSLIPDAFFDQGVDFILSFRITDPCGFIDTMTNEHDVDYAFRTGQKQYLQMNPKKTSGKPVGQNIFTST